MLSISDRSALLGIPVFKQEPYGKKTVLGMEIVLSEILIGYGELNEVMAEKPHAVKALFTTRGKIIEPVFRRWKEFTREGVVKNVQMIFLVCDARLKYSDCIMSDVHLKCARNGESLLSFGLRFLPPMPLENDVLRLIECSGTKIRMELYAPDFGDEASAPRRPKAMNRGKHAQLATKRTAKRKSAPRATAH